jgi:hypothetical protein
MTSKKPTPKSKSKSNSLKNSLKLLAGGENDNNAADPDKPKSTGFFSFLDKFKTEKPTDFNATNAPDIDMDKDKNKDSDITFKSNKLVSALSAKEEVSFTSNGEAKPSTGWFIFRVIIVLLIVFVFALNLTGYLDNVLESIKDLFYKYIAPIFIKIGLMKPSPIVASRSDQLPGDNSNTGTNTINQLDTNVGAKPVTTTPPVAAPPTASPPSAATTKTATKTSNTNSMVAAIKAYRTDPNLKPIPIQPNERRTPLENKGASARPPASQPAPYNEQLSREKEKQQSVKKALEYALKNQQPMGDNIDDGGLRIRRTKPGYCYIGEDRGFRSCIQVGPDIECMSGDIFPTMDVCVNPRLRA